MRAGVKRQFAFLVLALVCVLVLTGELARAASRGATFPNDSSPAWSFDARRVAFDRESPGRAAEVDVTPAGSGAVEHLLTGRNRGWQPAGGSLLVERGGATTILTYPSGSVDTVLGVDASWSRDGLEAAYRRNGVLVSGSGDDALFGGRGDDRLAAGAGTDLVEGGPDRDTLTAGPGNDTVEARDGFRDVVDCGPGRDTAEIDRLDVVRHCEHVLRP